MADHISVPSVGGAGIRRADAAWAPLSEPLFRSLWIAAVISYTGTWMQNVGAAWLMTQLTMNPLMVGLVQAAGALPTFGVRTEGGVSTLAQLLGRFRRTLALSRQKQLAPGLPNENNVHRPYPTVRNPG